MKKVCPYCDEKIDINCRTCPICGESLTQNESTASNKRTMKKSIITLIAFFCVILICITLCGKLFPEKHNDKIIQQAQIAAIEDPENIYVGEKDNLYAIEDGGYINSKGETVFTLPEKYNLIGEYREGHMVVGEYIECVKLEDPKEQHTYADRIKIVAKISIVDNKGNIKEIDGTFILPYGNMDYVYTEIPIFHNGAIVLTDIDGVHSAYDTKGNKIQYNDLHTLQEDEIKIELEEKKQADGEIFYTGRKYIKTKQGKYLRKLNNAAFSDYSEGSMAIAEIINKTNYFKHLYNRLIEPIIELGHKFNIEKVYKLYIVDTYKTTDKVSYIDKNGKVFLKTKYHTLYHYGTDWVTSYDAGFHNGLALLKDDNDNYVYINKNGIPVIKLKTKDCDPYNFIGKLAIIYYPDKFPVYINYKGDEVYKISASKKWQPFKININYEDIPKTLDINIDDINNDEYSELYKYKEQILE